MWNDFVGATGGLVGALLVLAIAGGMAIGVLTAVVIVVGQLLGLIGGDSHSDKTGLELREEGKAHAH